MQISSKIRNFGIIAHIDAGKTTTTERILYLSGMSHRIGQVDEGTTITDWMDEERERGITIVSAAVSCEWHDTIFHIIDTPGHVDFTAEVQRSLRVLDGAVVVFCAVGGVQTQSETVWKQADKYNIPRIIYINKLDRTGADFDNVINEIKEKLKSNPLPISIPVFENESLTGVIDLIKMKKISFENDGTIKLLEEIPDSETERVSKYRELLIDLLTEYDDRMLEAALQGNVTEKMLTASLRNGTLKRNFIPVIAGASLRNIGAPLLLDAISNYLPSPDDIGIIKALFVKKDEWKNIEFKADSPPVAYVFKVQYNREKGIIAFIRVYAGIIKNGDILYNPRTKKKERIQDLLRIYADKYERLDTVSAGDIVTISGLKNIATGDTLCSEGFQISLEPLKFPDPVIFVKVEPKNATDKDKLASIIDYLLLEDPTITMKDDEQTGQTLIGGMGELHIQIFLDRLRKHYKIDLKSGNPSVAYRETVNKTGEFTYNFDKKIEGNTQHASISLKIKPSERNTGNNIISNLSKKYKELIPFIEKGITDALSSGPEGAYPVIDCIITIESIEYDSSRSSPAAIQACANLCTSGLLRDTGTILLEPIMKIEIDLPEKHTGAVIGDLQSRNGIVLNIVKKMNSEVIHAKAPLKSMFGYTTNLRSQTQGKGAFSMEFLNYDLP